MAVVTDTFTDTSAVALASHTGETGATWAKNTIYATGSAAITDANRARVTSGGVVMGYYASGVPATADYDVEVDWFVVTVPVGGQWSIAGRMSATVNTMYYARYLQSTGEWQLAKLVAGTSTTFAGSVAATLTPGNTYHVKLEMRGTAIKMYVDDMVTPLISVTDSAVTAKGFAGLRIAETSPANAAGLHADNFAVEDVPTAPVNTVEPVVSGTQVVGYTLTSTSGTWNGSPTSYAYKWQRDGVDIAGETAATYVLAVADVGATISSQVAATNSGGTSAYVASSNGLAVVAAMVQADGHWQKAGASGLGGAPGATFASATDIFDSVLNSEAVAGDVEYRCVYFRNGHVAQTLAGLVAWISSQTSSADTTLAIGVATEGVSVNVAAIADEGTVPPGVSFSAPATFGTGLAMGDIPPNGFRGLWLRWTVTAGAAATSSDLATWTAEGVPA